jgi:hypothetical protein
MARRSVKRAVSNLLLSVVGILLVLVAMIIMIMREYPLQAPAVLLVGLTAVIG